MSKEAPRTDELLADLQAQFLPTFISDTRSRLRHVLGLIPPSGSGNDESFRTIAEAMHAVAGEAMLIGLPKMALLARAVGATARRFLDTKSGSAIVACARALRTLASALEELKAPTHAAPEDTHAGAQAESRQRTRVLVVDDSPLNAALLREGLEREGFEARTVGDDREKILLHLEDFRPQLLLLDWFMPGCDSRALCGEIRSTPLLSGTRIVLITGLPEQEAAELASQAGATAALTKELGIPAIVERVRALALKGPA
jgi:PleD family two-component response regulator